MKFAARMNSFYGASCNSVIEALNQIRTVGGISHVDMNYPEHFNENSIYEIAKGLKENNLKLNGIAPRFRQEFIRGEFTSGNSETTSSALDIAKKSVDVCRQLGGEVVTIWLGYDGYDYPFQLNYEKAWKSVVNSLKEICEYAKEIKISIEYKPFQPRVFSLISSFGDTMMLINDVGYDNIGITLDFCHMLMKGENPATGLSLASEKSKLYGIHLNDGNKLNDDGLMIGSINIVQTFEFIYYLKKYNYSSAVYFDTFPIREKPELESKANVDMFNKISDSIDNIGMDKIQEVIDKNDSIEIQKLLLSFLK